MSARLLRAVWVLVLWIAAPVVAWAEPNAAKVFPLSAVKGLPEGYEGTPERLTTALAKMIGGELSDQPIQSAATAAGCTLDDSTCLDRIARKHRVKEVVFGTVRVGDDLRVFVKLTRFIAGTERRERTFVLTAEKPSALAKQLVRSAREMFEGAPLGGEEGREEPVVPKEKEPKEREPREPVEKEPVEKEPAEGPEEPRPRKPVRKSDALRRELGEGEDGPDRREDRRREDLRRDGDGPIDEPPPVRRGRVTRGTYLLISGGVVAMAVGAGFGFAALALRDDLVFAKRNTPDDTTRIAAIESALGSRTTASAVFLVAGGVVVTGGIVRAVLQRRPVDPDRAVSVVPATGGGSLVFSGRW